MNHYYYEYQVDKNLNFNNPLNFYGEGEGKYVKY